MGVRALRGLQWLRAIIRLTSPPGELGVELSPGGVRMLERDVAAETGTVGVPGALTNGRGLISVELAPEVEHTLAEEVSVRLGGVPVELQVRGHGLQALAHHRVVLQLPYLSIQERRDGRVERGELGDEVVERGSSQHAVEVTAQALEQEALLETVVEDQVDGRAWLPLLVGRC